MKRKTIEPHVHSADYDRNFPLIDARGEMRVFNYRRRCNRKGEKKKRGKKKGHFAAAKVINVSTPYKSRVPL